MFEYLSIRNRQCRVVPNHISRGSCKRQALESARATKSVGLTEMSVAVLSRRRLWSTFSGVVQRRLLPSCPPKDLADGSGLAGTSEEFGRPDLMPGRADGPVDRGKLASERKQILFIANVDWFFNSHRLHIAKAALRQGMRVHVACGVTSQREVDRLRLCGVVVHPLPLHRSAMRPWGEAWLVVRLAILLVRHRDFVVHAVSIKPVLYAGLLSRVVRPRGFVAAISGMGYVFEQERATVLSRAVELGYRGALGGRSSVAVFQNSDDRRYFVENQMCRDDQARTIQGSGVDVDEFRPANVCQSPKRVVLLARLLRSKGILVYKRAADLLACDFPDTEFLVAGAIDEENPEGLSMEEWLSEIEGSHVRWVGHCDDIPNLLASCTMMVLPSRREGLSKSLLEGAAAGLPLVASDVPGNREIVRAGRNGLLASPSDANDLAACMRRLLEDEQMSAKFGREGRRMVRREFSSSMVADRTMRVYGSFYHDE